MTDFQNFRNAVLEDDDLQEQVMSIVNTAAANGSGLGDGATHQYSALPIIVAGSGGGKILNGKHLNLSATSGPVPKEKGKYVDPKQGLPLANLWLTQLQALGLKADRYADSTSLVKQLLV